MKVSKEAFEELKKRPHTEVRKETREKAVLYRDAWLELAQNLCRIQVCEDYKRWNYDTFEEYVEKELGISSREVRYWRAIYRKLVIDLGIRGDRLDGFHWCKLRLIVPVVNRHNVEQWLNRAERMTFTQLEVAVEEARKGKDPDDDGPTMDKLVVSVTSDEMSTILKAIEAAKKIAPTGNERDGHLLEMICLDFLGDHPDTHREALVSMIYRIEQVFHVKLLAIDKQDPQWQKLFEKARDVIREAHVEV
jgi:hypothetical protein